MQTLAALYGETRLSWLPSAPWHVLDPEYPHPVCYKSCTAPDGRFVPHGSAYTFLMYSRTGTINTLPSTTAAPPPAPPPPRPKKMRPPPPSESPATPPASPSEQALAAPLSPPGAPPPPPDAVRRLRRQLQAARDFRQRAARNAGGSGSLARGDSWGVRQSDHHAVSDLYALALANRTAAEGEAAETAVKDPRQSHSGGKDTWSGKREARLKRMLKRAIQQKEAAAEGGSASPTLAPRQAADRAEKGDARWMDYVFGFQFGDYFWDYGGDDTGEDAEGECTLQRLFRHRCAFGAVVIY